MILGLEHSNTTLVKVKSLTVKTASASIDNSNTTLVKVKFRNGIKCKPPRY